jgi:hypothetical protein
VCFPRRREKTGAGAERPKGSRVGVVVVVVCQGRNEVARGFNFLEIGMHVYPVPLHSTRLGRRRRGARLRGPPPVLSRARGAGKENFSSTLLPRKENFLGPVLPLARD